MLRAKLSGETVIELTLEEYKFILEIRGEQAHFTRGLPKTIRAQAHWIEGELKRYAQQAGR